MPDSTPKSKKRPHKVVIYLVREGRLLVFRRVTKRGVGASLEVPKGGLGKDEPPRRAVRRECFEESGVRPEKLRRLADVHVRTSERARSQRWRVYWGAVPNDVPDAFEHRVTGKGKDRGRRFRYHFEPLSTVTLAGPLGVALPRLRAHLAQELEESTWPLSAD